MERVDGTLATEPAFAALVSQRTIRVAMRNGRRLRFSPLVVRTVEFLARMNKDCHKVGRATILAVAAKLVAHGLPANGADAPVQTLKAWLKERKAQAQKLRFKVRKPMKQDPVNENSEPNETGPKALHSAPVKVVDEVTALLVQKGQDLEAKKVKLIVQIESLKAEIAVVDEDLKFVADCLAIRTKVKKPSEGGDTPPPPPSPAPTPPSPAPTPPPPTPTPPPPTPTPGSKREPKTSRDVIDNMKEEVKKELLDADENSKKPSTPKLTCAEMLVRYKNLPLPKAAILAALNSVLAPPDYDESTATTKNMYLDTRDENDINRLIKFFEHIWDKPKDEYRGWYLEQNFFKDSRPTHFFLCVLFILPREMAILQKMKRLDPWRVNARVRPEDHRSFAEVICRGGVPKFAKHSLVDGIRILASQAIFEMQLEVQDWISANPKAIVKV